MNSADPFILQSFVEEAFSFLPAIKNGIAEGGDEKEKVYRHAHTLRGASLMLGFNEIGEHAGFIEDTIEPFLVENREIDEQMRGELLLKTALIESLLNRFTEEQSFVDTPIDPADAPVNTQSALSENLFDIGEIARLIAANGDLSALGINFDELPSDEEQLDEKQTEQTETVAPTPVFAAESEADGDIDPEMLSIFSLEAEDHLRNIGAHLALLEHSPNNRESLAEVRRSAHTLKGAAGVVGFRLITQIAHRMEDLLDRIADEELPSTVESVSVLLASTDVLESLARGGSKEEFFQADVERIYARFDKLLTSETVEDQTNEEKENEDKIFAPFVPSLERLPDENFVGHLIAPDEKTLSVAEIIKESSPKTIKKAETNHERSEAEAETGATIINALEPRAVIRVSLDKVDEVVKMMGEIVLNRSVIEQRLAHVERQLSELNLSNQRLRRIASKLEIDYEAKSLNSGFTSFAPLSASGFSAPVSSSPTTSTSALNADFDALEFDSYTEFHQTTRELVEASQDTTEIGATMKNLLVDVETLLTKQKRFTEEMQNRLMKLRMVPLGALSQRLQRTVKVAAEQDAKQVELVFKDEDVEVDTQILDAVTEPLLHMLRNAVAHGIESSDERIAQGKTPRGTITLNAFHEGTNIVITVSDDGRGISGEKLRNRAVRGGFLTFDQAALMTDEAAQNLVFLPGLSTSEKISEISGRGVGMDIVRTVVERRQGTLKLDSTSGQGTTFTLRLPMSLVVTKAVIVRVAEQKAAIPQNIIRTVTHISEKELNSLTQSKTFIHGGETYRVASLNELLDLPFAADVNCASQIPLILLKTLNGNVALIVEQTLESTEIIIKKLVAPLDKLRILLGATILGDGSVVPILDMVNLLALTSRNFIVPTSPQSEGLFVVPEQINVMIVDDSPSVRRVMTKLISGAGWLCSAAKDGAEALEILHNSAQLPHVILTDVEMPRMDGYEFVSTLKSNDALSSIPVVMITSRGGAKHREKGFALGAAEYITKPYEEDFLLEKIRSLSVNRV